MVDGWTDWTVTPVWSDGTRTLKATIGHGLPLSYYQVTGGDAQIRTDDTPTRLVPNTAPRRLHRPRPRLRRLRPDRRHLVPAAPPSARPLGGKGYFSVAVLPTTPASTDATRTALATSYGRYAHAAVTGTTLTYAYDQAAAASARHVLLHHHRGGRAPATGTVVALYPHQWKALNGAHPDQPRPTSRRAAR